MSGILIATESVSPKVAHLFLRFTIVSSINHFFKMKSLVTPGPTTHPRAAFGSANKLFVVVGEAWAFNAVLLLPALLRLE